MRERDLGFRPLADGNADITSLFRAAEKIRTPRLSEHCVSACVAARRILDSFAENPALAGRAEPFLGWLHLLASTVERYAETPRTAGGDDEAARHEVMERTVREALGRFGDFHVNLFEMDVMSLDAEMRVLETALLSAGLLE